MRSADLIRRYIKNCKMGFYLLKKYYGTKVNDNATSNLALSSWARIYQASNGAFPLHGTVRFGTARYGTAQFGSVCISTAV